MRAFEAAGGGRSDAHRLDTVVVLCVDCHRTAEVGAIGREQLRALAGIG